jgi:hypothetical protein
VFDIICLLTFLCDFVFCIIKFTSTSYNSTNIHQNKTHDSDDDHKNFKFNFHHFRHEEVNGFEVQRNSFLEIFSFSIDYLVGKPTQLDQLTEAAPTRSENERLKILYFVLSPTDSKISLLETKDTQLTMKKNEAMMKTASLVVSS